MQTINYNLCPACNSSHITSVFSVKDYTVSNQQFDVWQCNNCTLQFTQNIPAENEIGSYYQSENYISHSDTNEGLINKLYHYVRTITLTKKKNIVEKNTHISKGKLLDIGAGTGAFAHTMQQANWQVTALEPDEKAKQVALEKYNLQLAEMHHLFEFQPNSFDAITMFHVMEHVHRLHNYFEIFGKILQPKGKIFIAVPNYTSYDAEYYQQHWAAYDVPRHLYHFSPKSMEQLCLLHNLKIVKTLPMWYDSFYIAMISEQYKNGKNNLVKAMLVGLLSNIYTLFNNKKCSSVIYVIEKK